MIQKIHSLKGRVRFKVTGLYRCSALKTILEAVLPARKEIKSVSASILTGNVLILYDPACNIKVVATLLENVAKEYLQHPDSALARTARERTWGRSWTSRFLAPSELPTWHVTDKETVLEKLNSTASGLPEDAKDKNLELFGPNTIPQAEPRSQFRLFLSQFNSLPVALLGAAAGISVVTGGLLDAVVIGAVMTINAVVGYATESEAERAIETLRQDIQPEAMILKSGKMVEVSSPEILVGDILVLRPGTYVAADARILEAVRLFLDESILTGENMPVAKNDATLRKEDLPLGDRVNMVYKGTLVTGGQGLAVVVAVGSFTEMGRVQSLMAESESPETPIERQLRHIGNQLVVLSGVVCFLVFVIGILRGNGILNMFKTSISLAVAAVPEGLPAVATTTLALGIRRMKERKVLIRNLEAVSTLGSIQTICFDKTGTVTANRMSVTRIYSGFQRIDIIGTELRSENGSSPDDSRIAVSKLIEIGILCNESQIAGNHDTFVLEGTPTENALMSLAIVYGIDITDVRSRFPLIATNYRSDDRQFMTTTHQHNNETLVAVKGSPLDVLGMCNFHLQDGTKTPLTDEDRTIIESENDSMAGDALRVLGMAYANEHNSDGDVNFTWLGLVGMEDPVRPGARESVEAFHAAGLDTIMVTGDQSPTAYAVGKQLGLNRDHPLEIVDSTHLSQIDPEVLKALSKKVHVFARVSPSNKLQIVQALQSAGKVVAMTGDGINDGPALKAADVGVAMGRSGTDVAREVADVMLEEDDLETMIVAIRDGRAIYDNIRKTLHYLLSTNFSEIEVMFVAGALGMGYPLNTMQLLWINLVSDIFPGLALALDPPEPDVMQRSPRDPQRPIVERSDFKRIGFESALMTISGLTAYGYGLLRHGAGPYAGTIAFQSLTNAQILHALSCRSEVKTIFDAEPSPPNPYLKAAIATSLGLQIVIQFVPGLRSLLGLTPLALSDWLVVGGASVIPLLMSEASKKLEQR
ncbi:cation-translocating P-type ATPase [Desulfomonile tiedjei]|uniref:P-type ATPase, translocating n=1 Tax=Desulfomonile tiedjei (strain ATCC 49306 / DSM 6799 / DCB-1) TaxID=706587 RepID=I4C059_DESTA|nr:HAD-IC family P-type ATPase [Desulfomonile tiedjei]AFM22950.1 P-type ATPase, translocating [Desulfomonile tiedjei DSM 6799]